MAYQITDLTLCPLQNESSIVTATVRCSGSKLSPSPTALEGELLGRKCKVIRMIQLSPDIWVLLGYRYDNDVSGPRTRETFPLANAERKSSYSSDTASRDTDHPDTDEDERTRMGRMIQANTNLMLVGLMGG